MTFGKGLRVGLGFFVVNAVLALLARDARCDDAPRAWSDLPLGSVPPVPTKKPGYVGAHERTPGVHVVAVPGGGGGNGAQIFASAEEEKATLSGAVSGLQGCFSQSLEHMGADAWSLGETRLMVWSNEGESVVPVRSERLVEDASQEKATLEIVDAWVDPRTKGAKTIARTSLPLVRVGGVLDDLRVYAARQEGASGKLLHVVVKRSASGARFMMQAFEVEGRVPSRGACEHAHVTVRADAPTGDVTVVRTNVVLPSREKTGESKPEVRTEADIVRAAEATPEGGPVEVRLREAEVSVGASQTTRDKAPVVSVSFGWSAREQQTQAFAAPRFVPKKRFGARKK
jgi:hypothetical protein